MTSGAPRPAPDIDTAPRGIPTGPGTAGLPPGVSGPPVGAVERWRAIPRRWRAVLIVIAVLAALNLLSSFVSGVTGGASGATGPSSTFDTSAQGAGALAQLLARQGHPVTRSTVPLAQASLSGQDTVFVLDPPTAAGQFTPADIAALRNVLDAGGRVVLGGPPPPGTLRGLLITERPPAWTPQPPGGPAHPASDHPVQVGLPGVAVVTSNEDGLYGDPIGPSNGTQVLLQAPAGPFAVASHLRTAAGTSTLTLLASSSPLRNSGLGQADNAALGIDLAGPPGAPVVFDEYDHGFDRRGTGLAGLPADWRWGLGIGLLAVLVWMLSAARRFGPPAPRERLTVPPRAEYVDAVATLLSAVPDDQLAEATEPVRAEARAMLGRKLRLAGTVGDQQLADALHAAAASDPLTVPHLPDGGVDAVLRPPRHGDDVLHLGEVFAALTEEVRS